MKSHVIEEVDAESFTQQINELLARYKPEDIVTASYTKCRMGDSIKHQHCALIITKN